MCYQEPNTLLIQISLQSLRKVRNHGKRNPIPNKIKEDQAKKILEEINYLLHANNLGSQDIDVPRGRHTTLKFFMKMMKRRRRRKKKKLEPKRNGMKQQKKNNPFLIQEKLQPFRVYLDSTP